MKYTPYARVAQYHETDQMGIIHHSNYIRWFEEARVDFMNQMGYSYDRMEREGISSPVLGVLCDYKSYVRFGDKLQVDVTIKEFVGYKMTVSYRVTDSEGNTLHAVGETRHCFLNRDGHPVALQKSNPELYALMLSVLKAK